MAEKEKRNPSLPTNKDVISYSELHEHEKCSFLHKLKHIDKINMFVENEHNNFGTAIHDSCQYYILHRIMRYEIALDVIVNAWKKFDLPNLGEALTQANAILEKIPDFLDTRFPGWVCFDAEEELGEQIATHNDVKFKGYIDAIIKYGDLYYIIDWKGSVRGWSSYKKDDELVKMQLVLYKFFWAQKHNIPLDKIRVGFAILNRDLSNPERIEFYEFDADETRTKKSLKILNNSIKMIKSKKYFKQWKYSHPWQQKNCRFCDYNGTKYCP